MMSTQRIVDAPALKVAVVGDSMLDVLRGGLIARCSPEDPNCPILEEQWRRYELGGAANVARWLANVPNFQVTLYAVTADDPSGNIFYELCQESRITLKSYLHRTGDATTVKERIISVGNQHYPRHLVRIDKDVNSYLTENEMVHTVEDLITGKYDAIVVADYQKAMFRGPHGEELRAHIGGEDPSDTETLYPYPETLYVVNSKCPQDWANNVIEFLVCNRAERNMGWANQNLSAIATSVKADHIVVTCAGDGVLADSRWFPTTSPVAVYTLAKNVVDVTGAGDAFTAGLVYKALQKKHGPGYRGYSIPWIQEILRCGSEWAAHCVGNVGCGEPICPTSLG